MNKQQTFSMRQLIAIKGGVCTYCDHAVLYKPPHIKSQRDNHATKEHLVTRSDAGSGSINNIDVACMLCNSLRGDKSMSFFRVFMGDIKKQTTFINRWHNLRPRQRKFIFQLCQKRYKFWQRSLNKKFSKVSKTRFIPKQ